MIYTVLYSYLLGWVVTSIGLALAVRRLQDPVQPQSHPIPLVIATGAAWPVVVLGTVQIAAIALVMNVARTRSIHECSGAFADNELDALLEERPNCVEPPVV
ncbi:MAG TPA: hypothetical protein VJ777_16655 [Mycobacterium sp.]|nr:hypothetical protein [Mycobacterium sp.]